MIKALFFDMDGTLLTSSGRISKKTIEALKACKELGIKVFTATGRPPLLAKMLNFGAEEQEIIKDGGVFCNGGCIRISDSCYYTCLPDEIVTKCIDAVIPFKEVNVVVQMENESHSFRYDLSDEDYRGWGVEKNELVPFERHKFGSVIKICFYTSGSFPKEMIEKLKESTGAEVNIYTYGDDAMLVEVVDKKANKMLGIRRTVEMLGWSEDEIAVFGDDCNDVEMLGGFKNSIAMGNARDEVKSHAAHVTLSNNEEGIYHALHKILKLI